MVNLNTNQILYFKLKQNYQVIKNKKRPMQNFNNYKLFESIDKYNKIITKQIYNQENTFISTYLNGSNYLKKLNFSKKLNHNTFTLITCMLYKRV